MSPTRHTTWYRVYHTQHWHLPRLPAAVAPPAVGPNYVDELDPSIAVVAAEEPGEPPVTDYTVDTAASATHFFKPKTKTFLYSW